MVSWSWNPESPELSRRAIALRIGVNGKGKAHARFRLINYTFLPPLAAETSREHWETSGILGVRPTVHGDAA